RKLAEVLKTADSQVLSQKQRLLLDHFASLNRELAGLDSQLRMAQVKVMTLEAPLRPGAVVPVPEYQVGQQVDLDPVVVKHLQEVYQLADKISRYRQVSKLGAIPEKLEREHQQAKERLETLRKEVRLVAVERIRRKVRGDAEATLRQAQEQVQLLTQQRK